MTGRRLLLWDSPNIDMVLGQVILRRKPKPAERPRVGALARWLADRAERQDALEACVFANVTEGGFQGVSGWAEVVRQAGFRMFLKPKRSDDSDVDDDIDAHAKRRLGEGGLGEVVLMSHDGEAFAPLAEELLAAGVAVTALVFPEHAGRLCQVSGVETVDLEDVPGLFATPLPRLTYASLPDGGAWLEPIGDLREAR